MRKLVKRLSGTNKKDSGKGLVNLQRIDVAALNRGFDEDGDGFEPSSPAQRLASPGSWGEKAVTENSAAIKMQARVRGKKARAEVARLSVLSEVSTAPPAKPALAFPEPPSGRTQWPAPPSAAANRNDAELKAAFDVIDTDQSGDIDVSELTSALRGINPDADDATIDGMIALGDVDGDKEISFYEFKKILTSPAVAKEQQGAPAP